MKRPILSLLLLLALVASACGSGDDSSVQTDEPTPEPTSTPADDGSGDDATGDDGTGDDGTSDTGSDDVATTDPDGAADDTSTDSDGSADQGADSGDSGDGAGADSGDSGTTEPPPAGDAEVIFAVFTTGGFVPVDVALSEFPELVVLSDGTAYRPGAQIAVFPPPLTPALERRRLDQAKIDRIQAAVDASTVIDPAIDFGAPNVTDVPFTRVTARLDAGLTEVEVFALGFDEGLAAEAREARAALTSLVGEVTGIVEEATDTGTLTKPPALGVLTFPGLTYQENDPVRPWPIDSVPQPQPPGAACVVITGAELDTLWDAAADATTQTPWNIGGETKAVALRPVFPHEDFC